MNYSLVTVGNPNSGKTSLFNALTGARQQVGNWSGVTVDKKMGEFSAKGQDYTLMDLPGIYSLANQEASLDEQIASRFVQGQQPDLLLNVIDAANLERSLYLTLQLRELGLPMVVVLNKMDLLQKRRITIDEGLLGQALGCPVVSLSAHNRQQVAAFKASPSPPWCWITASRWKPTSPSSRPCLPLITSATVAVPCACWRRTSPCRRRWRRVSRRRLATW